MINQISIVIPALDEEESIPSLIDELEAHLEKNQIEYEIIIVDDGSKTLLGNLINSSKVTVYENSFTRGQSYSLLKGIELSRYDFIATLDGDGQNPPNEVISC